MYGQLQLPELMTGKVEGKPVELANVMTTLEYFLSSSPIGEFKIRLQLIYNFHCDLLYSQKKDTKTSK